jgi:hypothetical protein
LRLATRLKATSEGRHLLYLHHGYRDFSGAPILLARDGPLLWPMVRQPTGMTPSSHPPHDGAGHPATEAGVASHPRNERRAAHRPSAQAAVRSSEGSSSNPAARV